MHYKASFITNAGAEYPAGTEMIGAACVLALLWYGSRLVLINHSSMRNLFIAFLVHR